ncbi:hypothetical protein Tco_0182177, partial [Tanacetum coccineum]
MTMFGSWHDKLVTLVASCFQRLALCFYNSCWGGSISPYDFLPSILLLLVVIIAVVIVVVMFVLVVVVDEGSSIIKLPFVII